MRKVHLILSDGMRPEAMEACGNPYVKELLDSSLVKLHAKTVMPSVTLPCHMSLFHSVDPTRHGIATNTYVPQVRPIRGLFEVLKANRKKSGFFYDWHELRDLARPGSVAVESFFQGDTYGYEQTMPKVLEASLKAWKEDDLDFAFTYFGWSDGAGHGKGWMTEEYLRAVSGAFDCIRQLIENAPEDCVTIVTADHGGHDRTHGTTMDEDMLIPIIIHGAGLQGIIEQEASIKDLAPTIVKLLGCEPDEDWEGVSLL